MSGSLERQLREDRALRDAARALLDADIAHLKANLAGKSIPSRIADRISEGASDALGEAFEAADNHKGALAALVAAIVLWLARNPLIALFTDGADDAERDARNNR